MLASIQVAAKIRAGKGAISPLMMIHVLSKECTCTPVQVPSIT
jgi:hypothetical protein